MLIDHCYCCKRIKQQGWNTVQLTSANMPKTLYHVTSHRSAATQCRNLGPPDPVSVPPQDPRLKVGSGPWDLANPQQDRQRTPCPNCFERATTWYHPARACMSENPNDGTVAGACRPLPTKKPHILVHAGKPQVRNMRRTLGVTRGEHMLNICPGCTPNICQTYVGICPGYVCAYKIICQRVRRHMSGYVRTYNLYVRTYKIICPYI